MPTSTTKTSYSEVSADDVARFFVQGYKLNPGERLAGHEYFFDATKGVFVFKLTTEASTAEQ
ncbi:hypothetical protein D3C86_1900830 [compost metagenome]